MSMEDLIGKLDVMSDKVNAIIADMNKLKDREKAIEEPPPHCGSRSRSRSPLHTRTRRAIIATIEQVEHHSPLIGPW